MSSFDVLIQSTFLYCLLPLGIIILILRLVFNFNYQKLIILVQYLPLRCLHKKLAREKHLLFDQFTRVHEENAGTSRRNPSNNMKILEIGAGTGRNFDFYPKGTDLTVLEPNPHCEDYLKKSVQNSNNKFVKLEAFVQGFAEDMSVFEDNSFDAAVCTLVLCSVKSQDAVLEEVRRVLKPGATFYFLEHVAAKKGSIMRWIQEKFDYIHPLICDNCHFARETWSSFDKANFKSVNYRELTIYLLLCMPWPLMYGTATK